MHLLYIYIYGIMHCWFPKIQCRGLQSIKQLATPANWWSRLTALWPPGLGTVYWYEVGQGFVVYKHITRWFSVYRCHFELHLFQWNYNILIRRSAKIIHDDSIDNEPEFVQVKAWTGGGTQLPERYVTIPWHSYASLRSKGPCLY